MHRLHEPATNSPALRVTLPADDGSLAVVRHVIRGFREAYAIAPATMDDIVLAVSEAAANCAQHAYDDERGTFTVMASADGDRLHVVVSDGGRGLSPPRNLPQPAHGLSLMAHVALSIEILSGPAGTDVFMSFDISDDPIDASPERAHS